MSEEQHIPIYDAQEPSEESKQLVALFHDLDSRQLDFLDAAAKSIIERVATFLAIVFGVTAFGSARCSGCAAPVSSLRWGRWPWQPLSSLLSGTHEQSKEDLVLCTGYPWLAFLGKVQITSFNDHNRPFRRCRFIVHIADLSAWRAHRRAISR